MKLQVEVISKELVKPSSPTPHHLRHLNFSFFDQLTPKVSIPFIHFYSSETTISILAKCNLLKKSLSQALTLFYPLAGRVKNDSYADCNDEGFLYIEARASCSLSYILQERNPVNNNYFTPFRPDEASDFGGFAQITLFECGGLAISFSMCHKLGDASSMCTFLNTWAAMARGDTKSIATPSFGHAVAFPPIVGFNYGATFFTEQSITKNFVFDRSSIDALKAKYRIANYNNGRKISSVEAITRFIIGRYIATTRTKKANNLQCMVMHTMDLRPRLEPPKPKMSFGNIATAAPIEAEIDANDEYCFEIAERIKISITNMAKYINKHQSNLDQVLSFINALTEKFYKKDLSFIFSALNKFPMYESDFGWGKPLWVGTTPIFAPNQVYLFGTKDGEGIEAWISLNEQDMASFEADELVLQHAFSSSQGKLFDTHSKL